MSGQAQKKRPRDLNQLAAAIVADATAEEEPEPNLAVLTPDQPEAAERNPAAVALGRLGGQKGGPARAAKLSPERRREIARRAAASRWASRERPAS